MNLKRKLSSFTSAWAGWPSGYINFQAGYRGFESRSGRDNFQTISTPSSYSTCPGLSIKWTGRRLVTDSGTKCAWMIHESKAVQIHVHNNRRCLGCLVALKIRTTTTTFTSAKFRLCVKEKGYKLLNFPELGLTNVLCVPAKKRGKKLCYFPYLFLFKYVEDIYSFAVNTINIAGVRFGISASKFWRP